MKSDETNFIYKQYEYNKHKILDIEDVVHEFMANDYECMIESHNNTFANIKTYPQKWFNIVRSKYIQDRNCFVFYYSPKNSNLQWITFLIASYEIYNDNDKKMKCTSYYYYDAFNKIVLAFTNHFFKRINSRRFYDEYEHQREIIRQFLIISKNNNKIFFNDQCVITTGNNVKQDDANIIDCGGTYLGKIIHDVCDGVKHFCVFGTYIPDNGFLSTLQKLKKSTLLKKGNGIKYTYNFNVPKS